MCRRLLDCYGNKLHSVINGRQPSHFLTSEKLSARLISPLRASEVKKGSSSSDPLSTPRQTRSRVAVASRIFISIFCNSGASALMQSVPLFKESWFKALTVGSLYKVRRLCLSYDGIRCSALRENATVYRTNWLTALRDDILFPSEVTSLPEESVDACRSSLFWTEREGLSNNDKDT